MEVLTAVGLVNNIRQIPVEVIIDSTEKKQMTCGTGIRGRISVSPICGIPTNYFREPESDGKEMQDTIIHEARHIWQDDQSQRDDPGDARLHDDIPAGQPIPGTNFRQGPLNDEDFDGYMDAVQFSSGTALLLHESQ